MPTWPLTLLKIKKPKTGGRQVVCSDLINVGVNLADKSATNVPESMYRDSSAQDMAIVLSLSWLRVHQI